MTEELTAAWWGWPARTLEYAVAEGRLGPRWSQFVYGAWLKLSAFDRFVDHIVPDGLYYNVSVSAQKPR